MIREILKLLSRDNLQVQALTECYQMLDLCHPMVHAAVRSLRESDTADLDVDVYEVDRKLNSFERDVRRKVMTHLSLQNVADISSGLTLVSIVVDIERIGDYTKNIADLARNHPTRLDAGPLEETVAEIEQLALGMFDSTVTTFKTGDIDEARSLMRGYKDEISPKCADIEEQLVAGRVEMAMSEAVTVALYARFLKRIAAHSRNLVSSLVNPFDRIGYTE